MKGCGISMLLKTLILNFVCILSAILIGAHASAQGPCKFSDPAEIVLILDSSGSMSESELSQVKLALEKFINYFADASGFEQTKMALISVGCKTNSGSCPSTGVKLRKSLTFDLQDVKNSLNNIEKHTGPTHLQKALNVATDELTWNGDPSVPNYIVLVSDGLASIPKKGNTSGVNQFALEAAAGAADNAKQYGIKILTVHRGTIEKANKGKIFNGEQFLLHEVATSAAYHFPGDFNTEEVFKELSQQISCNAGDGCTIYACNQATLQCEAFPINPEVDFDGDGVLDCNDTCAHGDDTVLGKPCVTQSPGCQTVGTYICVAGNLICNGIAVGGFPEICDGVDNDCDGVADDNNICACDETDLSAQISVLKKIIANQEADALLLAKNLSKLVSSKKAAKLKANLKLVIAKNQSFINALPLEFLSCPLSENCTAVSVTGEVNGLSQNAKKLSVLAKKIDKLLNGKYQKSWVLVQEIQSLAEIIETKLSVFPTASDIC